MTIGDLCGADLQCLFIVLFTAKQFDALWTIF